MQIDTVIFCEDIRNEQNNKKSLMGLYNDKILIRADKPENITMPIPARLCCFLRLICDESENIFDEFEFTYVLPTGDTLPVKGSLKSNKNSRNVVITIMAEGLPIQPGKIGFKLAVKAAGNIIYEFKNDSALVVQIAQKEDGH
jgi:hypothetical protein